MTTPPGGSPSESADPARHPGRHRGSHAAPPSPLRQLVRSLFAVAVVAAVVLAFLHWRGDSSPSADSSPVVTPPSATSSPTPTATPSRSSTPSPAPSPKPSKAKPKPKPKPTPTAAIAPLLVLNNSRRTGLAHRAAAQYEAKGWPIQGTGNFRGQVAETTVYYTPGNAHEKLAAQTLHRQFSAVKRVHPRFAGLPGHGVTVVLTADYPA